MSVITFYRLSGGLIILIALGFTVSQIGIIKIFNYPQILRSPVDVILQNYNDGGRLLKFFWTLFAFSSLMLIPMSGIFYKILNTEDTPYLIIGTFFGIATGIFYVLGLMRWVFLADDLSKKYIKENNDSKIKETYEIVFQAFHIYCGNSIGETMGFICMGIWVAITGISMISSSIFSSFAGAGFILCGIGIAFGPLEWLDIKFANKINKISMKLLMCFLIYIGIRLVIYS